MLSLLVLFSDTVYTYTVTSLSQAYFSSLSSSTVPLLRLYVMKTMASAFSSFRWTLRQVTPPLKIKKK